MKTTHCRFCNQILPEALLKLPDTPLANEFLSKPGPQETFPLQLTSCSNCHLYQLNYSVDAERLFNKDYAFVSGTSKLTQNHFRKYAEDVISRFKLQPGDFVAEIASNDGTLLKVFQEHGMKVLGIDPASSIANKATKDGIETIPDFFTEELAEGIAIKYGKAKVIMANNVLAHLDGVNDIVKGVKKLLDKNGVFIFENSYFKCMYEKGYFDILYSEHFSYPLVFPMQFLFKQNDMCLFDVVETEVHGGSIRGFVSNKFRSSETVDSFIKVEKELGLITNGDKNIKMTNWQKRIAKLGEELNTKLKEYKNAGKTIAVFGVPAKATTLLSTFYINDKDISFAIDENPLKQNKYVPGRKIKIYPLSYLINNQTDYLLLLAWNFSDSIIHICKKNGYNGNFIIPLPKLDIK